MKPRILVVDDEPLVRVALSETIRRKGFESVMACDGEDALLQFKRSSASLVFADIRMPRMDGLELLKQIKMVECPPRVVLITAYGSVETAVEAMKGGPMTSHEAVFGEAGRRNPGAGDEYGGASSG